MTGRRVSITLTFDTRLDPDEVMRDVLHGVLQLPTPLVGITADSFTFVDRDADDSDDDTQAVIA